jgi:Mrp family chromosome partitioning ATPase
MIYLSPPTPPALKQVERWTQSFDPSSEQSMDAANGYVDSGSGGAGAGAGASMDAATMQERSMQKFYKRMEKSRVAKISR